MWCGARRRSVGEPGLKIAKPSRLPRAAGMVRVPEDHRVRVGEAAAQAGEPAGARARRRGPSRSARPPTSTVRVSGSRACSSAESTFPRTACTGGPSACERVEHRRLHEVAGVQDRVGARAGARRTRRGSAAVAARHVRVTDDREPHARSGRPLGAYAVALAGSWQTPPPAADAALSSPRSVSIAPVSLRPRSG